MPNWWLPWAERIALALADLWARSRPGTGPAAGDGGSTVLPERPDARSDVPDAPPAPRAKPTP